MAKRPTTASLEEVSRLAENTRKLTDTLREVLRAAETVEVLTDTVAPHVNDEAIRKEYQRTTAMALEVYQTARAALRRLNCLEATTELLVEAAKAAKEMVQADNACILGREGAEKRWDEKMKELKAVIGHIKD